MSDAAHTAPRCEKCGGPKPGERLTCSLDECPYMDSMTYGQGLPPAGGWKRDMPEDRSTALTYRCATCGKSVTVAHAAAWPSQCPHCKTAPPTLILKVPS